MNSEDNSTVAIECRTPRSTARWGSHGITTLWELIDWCRATPRKDTPVLVKWRTQGGGYQRWDTDVGGLAAYAHAKLAEMQIRKKRFLRLREKGGI